MADRQQKGSFKEKKPPMELIHYSYARVGLMGNPSDGYYGKTISFLISNFFVRLTLIPNHSTENSIISFLKNGNSNNDCNLSFDSLNSLVEMSKNKGYDKENCLLQATCKTTNLILSVEKDELNISAGLQDRVIQVYGGLVYMDFNKDQMTKHGFGIYEKLDINLLPKGLWIAYELNHSDSGEIHTDVRKRYESGDQKVIDAMKQFISFTEQARNILIHKNETKRRDLAELMNKNFDLRREIFGDQILGLWNGDDDDDPAILTNAEKLKNELVKKEIRFCWLIPQ
ncbi:glucuronokinase 1-like [Rhizophagus clarus]|uniref:Glucuronokinase 1-like n=1 Tax=Rhizophagus clarus TaxID=94130 RepID=A0A8H3M742_9GLOM|nr:glucuronokinase 1-like [Rhizophagus clarus]